MMDIVERLRRHVGNADINETAAADEIERLTLAISQSHDLLRQYAFLLNRLDGGKRTIPVDLVEWIDALNREEPP